MSKSGFKLPTTKSAARTEKFERGGERRSTAGTTRITVDMEPELHRRLKIAAAMRGGSMADIVRDLVATHIPEKP